MVPSLPLLSCESSASVKETSIEKKLPVGLVKKTLLSGNTTNEHNEQKFSFL